MIQTDHLIAARWPDLTLINKNKITYQIVDHRGEIKESEKYLNHAWELDKM